MAFKAKRQFQRSALREGVKLRTSRGVEYSTLEDLSAGGLKLFLDHDFAIGTMIELSFTLRPGPGVRSEEVKVIAKVVRSVRDGNSYQVGVQFLDLNDSVRVKLQSLVDANDGPF